MLPHEFAQALHSAAITLENDGELYQKLPAWKSRCKQRRVLWARLVKLDPELRSDLVRLYDGCCAVENLRRYLVDTWDIDTAAEEEPAHQSYAKQPTIEFWKPEVREPPKKTNPEWDAIVAQQRAIQEHSAVYAALTDQLNQLNSLTQKETTMSKIIDIKTKTFVNGIDVTTLTNAQVFDLIAEQEAAIKKLEGIEAKPKLLVKEIEERKAGIAALVAHLDAKAE